MKLARLTVHSGAHERNGCPLQTQLALDTGVDLERLLMWDRTADVPVPVQAWAAGDGLVELAWVVSSMNPIDTRVYDLWLDDEGQPQTKKGVQLRESIPGKLDVDVGGEYFASYNYGNDVVRPYLYPVMARGGMGITRDWPMAQGAPGEVTDHVHHKGIYTARDEVNGINNWGEGSGHGWINHREFSQLFSGTVVGGLTDELDWTDADRKTNMTETRRLAFYLTPAQARVFDYEVTFRASEGEVTLADTKEGGHVAVRVASSMNVTGPSEGGRIENAYGGVNQAECWGKRAPWCDYSGPRCGEWRGIAIMDHPDNPRYPTHWHVRDYGLMAVNPIALHHYKDDPSARWDLVIPAGESVRWRYRVLDLDGDAREAKVAEHWHDFVNPPQVQVG